MTALDACESTTPQSDAERKRIARDALRLAMPGCYEIVQAFAGFQPRVNVMAENGKEWRR